jgi:hypothetical protein
VGDGKCHKDIDAAQPWPVGGPFLVPAYETRSTYAGSRGRQEECMDSGAEGAIVDVAGTMDAGW